MSAIRPEVNAGPIDLNSKPLNILVLRDDFEISSEDRWAFKGIDMNRNANTRKGIILMMVSFSK